MILHEKGEMRDGWGSCAHAIVISVRHIDIYTDIQI